MRTDFNRNRRVTTHLNCIGIQLVSGTDEDRIQVGQRISMAEELIDIPPGEARYDSHTAMVSKARGSDFPVPLHSYQPG